VREGVEEEEEEEEEEERRRRGSIEKPNEQRKRVRGSGKVSASRVLS
jgi:hypothetical protein